MEVLSKAFKIKIFLYELFLDAGVVILICSSIFGNILLFMTVYGITTWQIVFYFYHYFRNILLQYHIDLFLDIFWHKTTALIAA